MGIPASDQSNRSKRLYGSVFKRFFDFVFATLLAILLFPLMGILAVWIKLDSKGPILFKQQRVGKGGKLFTIYKFRSMSDDAPHQMATSEFSSAQSYITRSGRIMRKASLDELPQLFNVIKGEMSFIGPRPLIPKEKEVLELRHTNGSEQLLPGITGLAQVRGRDEVTDVEKAGYDGEYAQSISFWYDAKIIFKTFFDVIQSRGIHDGNK